MQNMGLLMEYEDILLKKRKDFSATYIGQNASQKDIKELFQYVFENYWDGHRKWPEIILRWISFKSYI